MRAQIQQGMLQAKTGEGTDLRQLRLSKRRVSTDRRVRRRIDDEDQDQPTEGGETLDPDDQT